jgi:general secretion pathway protein K
MHHGAAASDGATARAGEAAMTLPDPRHRGIALVVVLWIVTILALQVSIFNVTVRDAASLGSNELAMARGEQLASAGIELAVARILDPDPARRWDGGNTARMVRFGGAALEIVVHSEGGRLDLNGANEDLLSAALYPYARSPSTTTQWVERVLDWRDVDDERRPNGAEAGDYGRAGLAYGPRNGRFLHPLELGRVLGVPPEIARTLANRLTVYGIDGKINPLSASREVLMMLPGANAAEVDNALRIRERAPDDAEAVIAALASAKDWLTVTKAPVYRIEVTVRGEQQSAFGHAEAIVLVDQTPRTEPNAALDATPPMHILSWSYEPRAAATNTRSRR